MGAASFIPHLDLDAVLRLIQAATYAHPPGPGSVTGF